MCLSVLLIPRFVYILCFRRFPPPRFRAFYALFPAVQKGRQPLVYQKGDYNAYELLAEGKGVLKRSIASVRSFTPGSIARYMLSIASGLIVFRIWDIR